MYQWPLFTMISQGYSWCDRMTIWGKIQQFYFSLMAIQYQLTQILTRESKKSYFLTIPGFIQWQVYPIMTYMNKGHSAGARLWKHCHFLCMGGSWLKLQVILFCEKYRYYYGRPLMTMKGAHQVLLATLPLKMVLISSRARDTERLSHTFLGILPTSFYTAVMKTLRKSCLEIL